MRRIVVVGTSCSGKTVMAKSIARALGLPHYEIDSLVWLPKWSLPSDEALLAKVDSFTSADRWVIDGVFPEHRNLVWGRADTVVWLNFPLSTVFTRALVRTIKRCISREQLGNHNVETWRRTFLSRNSQLLWVLKTWRKRRRDYPKIMRRAEFAHIRFVQLRSPGEAQEFLSRLPGASVLQSAAAAASEIPINSAPGSGSSAWPNHGSSVRQVPA
jgi:adenylate kinase family enzyme